MHTARPLLAICSIGVITLVAFIVWSSFEMSLADGLRAVVGTRWGITTMVDLYAGLLLGGAWIAWRERRVLPAAGWLLALLLLGNLALLVYVALAAGRASTIETLLMPKPFASRRD